MGRIEKALSNEADFRLSIRAAVRGLWKGDIGTFAFVDSMSITLRRGLTSAWLQGASTCGLRQSDMTPQELDDLSFFIANQIVYLPKFARDIRASQKGIGKLTPLLARAEMWVNRYGEVLAMGLTACEDQKLKWVMNPAKENCTDCIRLNNRIYRSSVWKRYNIRPRMSTLE